MSVLLPLLLPPREPQVQGRRFLGSGCWGYRSGPVRGHTPRYLAHDVFILGAGTPERPPPRLCEEVYRTSAPFDLNVLGHGALIQNPSIPKPLHPRAWILQKSPVEQVPIGVGTWTLG